MLTQVQRIRVMENSLAFWGLGQEGVIIKGTDAVIAIDPYLSDQVDQVTSGAMKRNYPPPIQPHELTNLDYVLVTHEHIDHFDAMTLEPLMKAAPQTRLVMPEWCREETRKIGISDERIIIPETLKPFTLPGTSLRLTAIPAAHETIEHDPVKGHRWIGYLIEWNGVTVYHAGDTVIYDGYLDTMRTLPTPDIAMIPINGRDTLRLTEHGLIGNFMPAEAAQVAVKLGWGMVVPLHNDMYPLNSLPWTQWTRALEDFAPMLREKRLQPGELYYYVKA
jgi:L-ascorbate metabolism protein UlaG (beta-lactamase superfamily)